MGTLCNAPTRSGGMCKRVAGPSGRCYWHGEAPLGAAGAVQLPLHQTNTRWANDIPARLLDRYKLAADDPDVLALHYDIALLDARIADVLSRVDTGESGAIWKKAQTAYEELETALDNEDEVLTRKRREELRELLTEGRNDSAAWLEVIALIGERRKLVESEAKRRTTARTMMRVEDLLTYAKALTEATRRHVSDPATRTAIGREFVHILGLPDRDLDDGSQQPNGA